MSVDDTVNWLIDGARTAPSPVALLEETLYQARCP